MATLLIAMLFAARDLNLAALLSRGFKHPLATSVARAIRGFLVAMCAIAILFALALAVGGAGAGDHRAAAALIPKYLLSAIAIALIEEAFFRAFLLGGMKQDFGNRVALIASAAIYALAHLVRSPTRYYVSGYEPAAGLFNLAHSVDQFSNPAIAIPTLIGLFLLGLVLGEAYILTGSVYFSMGLHCGFVLGSKLWPKSNPEPRCNFVVDSRRRRNPVDRRRRRMGDSYCDTRDTRSDNRSGTRTWLACLS